MGVKQYKVLTQNDKFFGGRLDAKKLEEALNSLAREGWVVIAVTTQDIPNGFGKMQQQTLVILENGR